MGKRFRIANWGAIEKETGPVTAQVMQRLVGAVGDGQASLTQYAITNKYGGGSKTGPLFPLRIIGSPPPQIIIGYNDATLWHMGVQSNGLYRFTPQGDYTFEFQPDSRQSANILQIQNRTADQPLLEVLWDGRTSWNDPPTDAATLNVEPGGGAVGSPLDLDNIVFWHRVDDVFPLPGAAKQMTNSDTIADRANGDVNWKLKGNATGVWWEPNILNGHSGLTNRASGQSMSFNQINTVSGAFTYWIVYRGIAGSLRLIGRSVTSPGGSSDGIWAPSKVDNNYATVQVSDVLKTSPTAGNSFTANGTTAAAEIIPDSTDYYCLAIGRNAAGVWFVNINGTDFTNGTPLTEATALEIGCLFAFGSGYWCDQDCYILEHFMTSDVLTAQELTDMNTYAIDRYSTTAPGGVDPVMQVVNSGSTILYELDENGKIHVGGEDPQAAFHATSTAEQLRLGYDSTNYFKTTVASTGVPTWDVVSATSSLARATLNHRLHINWASVATAAQALLVGENVSAVVDGNPGGSSTTFVQVSHVEQGSEGVDYRLGSLNSPANIRSKFFLNDDTVTAANRVTGIWGTSFSSSLDIVFGLGSTEIMRMIGSDRTQISDGDFALGDSQHIFLGDADDIDLYFDATDFQVDAGALKIVFTEGQVDWTSGVHNSLVADGSGVNAFALNTDVLASSAGRTILALQDSTTDIFRFNTNGTAYIQDGIACGISETNIENEFLANYFYFEPVHVTGGEYVTTTYRLIAAPPSGLIGDPSYIAQSCTMLVNDGTWNGTIAAITGLVAKVDFKNQTANVVSAIHGMQGTLDFSDTGGAKAPISQCWANVAQVNFGGQNYNITEGGGLRIQTSATAASYTMGTIQGIKVEDFKGWGTTNYGIHLLNQTGADPLKGNIYTAGSGHDTGHLQVNQAHIWRSSAGVLRGKATSPSTENDGFNLLFHEGAQHSWTAHQFYQDLIGQYFGTGNDAVIYYDGTNLIIEPDIAGSGYAYLGGTLYTENLRALISSELTISSGAITRTAFVHSVDTEGDAASDDLATISGGTAGDFLIIGPANDARTVVVKHATGNIRTLGGSDITLDTINKQILLYYHSTGNWVVLGDGVGGGGSFDPGTSYTWTANQTVNDSVLWQFGTGNDATIGYDGTNLIINPDAVGSGVLSVAGGLQLGGTLNLNSQTITDSTNVTIDVTGAATRQLFIGNSTASQVCDVLTDGTFQFRNNTNFIMTLTSPLVGSDRTITFPDATDTVLLLTESQAPTNKNLTATTNRLRRSKGITVESPTSSEDITWFFTDRAITVTQVRAVLANGAATPTVTYQVFHATDRSAAGTGVTTSAAVTNTTTGADATLNDATIPADSWVWLETTAQSGTVPEISIFMEYTDD